MNPEFVCILYSTKDKLKTSLIDALVRLGCAQADVVRENLKTTSTQEDEDVTQEEALVMSTTGDVTPKDVDDTVQQLSQWADHTDSKVRCVA